MGRRSTSGGRVIAGRESWGAWARQSRTLSIPCRSGWRPSRRLAVAGKYGSAIGASAPSCPLAAGVLGIPATRMGFHGSVCGKSEIALLGAVLCPHPEAHKGPYHTDARDEAGRDASLGAAK